MLYLTRLLLAVVLITGVFAIRPAGAAPTVKQLGGTTFDKTNQESITKSTTVSAPSVRALGLSTKSGTNTTKSPTNTMVPKVAAINDSARLSGLHGNLVKGIGSKLSANLSSQPGGGTSTADLTQRVINLEIEMANKQGILEPGDGINVDGNTISLSDEILTLSEQMEGIVQEIDDLKEQFDTDNYYTKEDIDTIVGKFSNAKIADHFDPGFLHLTTTAQQ